MSQLHLAPANEEQMQHLIESTKVFEEGEQAAVASKVGLTVSPALLTFRPSLYR